MGHLGSCQFTSFKINMLFRSTKVKYLLSCTLFKHLYEASFLIQKIESLFPKFYMSLSSFFVRRTGGLEVGWRDVGITLSVYLCVFLTNSTALAWLGEKCQKFARVQLLIALGRLLTF